MNECPGEGPGHDRQGPCQRPQPEELPWEVFRARPFSPDRKAVFGDASRRPGHMLAKARERPLAAAHRNVEVGGNREGIGRDGPAVGAGAKRPAVRRRST